MDVSEARERVDRSQDAGRSVFDVTVSKLLRPLVRPETIQRPPLIERLVNSNGVPIVSVAAPAGYGKTTLLSQWADRDPRAFAWAVSLNV